MKKNRFPQAVAAMLAMLPAHVTAAAPAETVGAVVVETHLDSKNDDKLAFAGSVETTAPAGRAFQVYFQIRLNGGEFLKYANDKNVLLLSKEFTTAPDAAAPLRTDCRVEFPLRDVETAVNLPHGQESIVWVDCSVWDMTAGRYITSDFTVSTPLLVAVDGSGKIVKVDADGVWDRMFRSADAETRNHARAAAETTAPRSKAALPVLIAVLGDPDEVLRRCAVLAIEEIATKYNPDHDAEAAALRKATADKDPWVCLDAAQALYDLTKTEDVIPVAVRLLDQPEVATRAADLLARIGRPAAPALRKVLQDGDDDARPEAAVILLRQGADAKAAVAVLIDCLQKTSSADGAMSKEAAMAANRFDAVGPNDGEAVPALIDVLKEGNGLPQSVIVRALGQIGPDASPAVGPLTELLKSQDVYLRRDVTVALGLIGPKAKDALPRLTETMKDQDANLRLDAASAVWSIDKSNAALAELLEGARDRDESIRNKALSALTAVGAEGKGAYEAVARVLHEDESHSMRIEAANALPKFGARAVPDLLRALKEGPKEDRNMVILALSELKGAARDAVPAIQAALTDDDTYVRAAAAVALKRIDPEAARRAGVPPSDN